MRLKMNMLRIRNPIAAGIFISLILAGCNLPGGQSPTQDTGLLYTQAAQTFVAQRTQAPAATTVLPTLAVTTAAATTAASATLAPSNTPEPSPTLTPTPSSSPTLPPAVLVFSDDFSKSTGWVTALQESYGFEYTQDGYRMYVNFLNDALWSGLNTEYTDVRIEVDAVRLAGPEDGYYGIACRSQDENNYYALVVSPGGQIGIARKLDSDLVFLAQGSAPAGTLHPGEALNRIAGDCTGSNLVLYANGQKLLEAQDDSFASGGIGLVAGTRKQTGIDILFDNLAVLKP
jgi:hypothetical protein